MFDAIPMRKELEEQFGARIATYLEPGGIEQPGGYCRRCGCGPRVDQFNLSYIYRAGVCDADGVYYATLCEECLEAIRLENAELAARGMRAVARREQDPEFIARVKRARREMIAEAAGRMASALTTAIDKLEELLDSNCEDIQLQAACAIISHVVKLREHADLQERLAGKATYRRADRLVSPQQCLDSLDDETEGRANRRWQPPR